MTQIPFETNLVLRTCCSFCGDSLDVKMSRVQFEQRAYRILKKWDGSKPELISLKVTNGIYDLPCICDNCNDEEPDHYSLNKAYWENYSISNPNDNQAHIRFGI